MTMKKLSLGTIFILFFLFSKAGEPVRNVIFMIGDGMGVAQVNAAMLSSQKPLSMERAVFAGLCKTQSANNRVTDSAAAGTALSTGVKTNNGTVGMDAAGGFLANVREQAAQAGLATGVVVTKDITDATPAAFMAHQSSRGSSEKIALQIARCGVDVFMGGGLNNFEKRSDGAKLTDSLRARGYAVAYTVDEALAVKKGRLAAILAPSHMAPAAKGRGDYLPQATDAALRLLAGAGKKGFFLMVEGSMIDTGGHENDINFVVTETVDFDNAVGAAFDFADRNPGTLVIITADHETGGLTLPSGKADFLLGDQGLKPSFSTGGHTAVMVPVFAYGAGAEAFTGIMDNTDIPKKIREALKIK